MYYLLCKKEGKTRNRNPRKTGCMYGWMDYRRELLPKDWGLILIEWEMGESKSCEMENWMRARLGIKINHSKEESSYMWFSKERARAGRQRQEDSGFKASLGYMERYCLKTNTQTELPRKIGAVQDSDPKHKSDLITRKHQIKWGTFIYPKWGPHSLQRCQWREKQNL